MGLGYKGDTGHHHTIGENIDGMKNDYPINDGYFGSKSDNKDNRVRHIESSDPSTTAKDFYDRIANGGIEKEIMDKSGKIKGATAKMADGSIVTWRNVSNSDGSPAVDINISKTSASGGLKLQKIHFIKG
ncbi:MAG: hypothetical protein J5752_07500 [Clostridiales bacterium]|nr:hypothetical protein [Clostridiales bacterium]